MDALTEKGFRDFMATGTRPIPSDTAVVTVEVAAKPDPIVELLWNLCAVGLLAKDLHYRAKGKAFYAVHILSDLVYDATRLFDELNEVYFLGECKTVPPAMATISKYAADLASRDGLGIPRSVFNTQEEDSILSNLIYRCDVTAGLVEECKSIAPKSGTNAVLDEISKKMLQASGLLARTEVAAVPVSTNTAVPTTSSVATV